MMGYLLIIIVIGVVVWLISLGNTSSVPVQRPPVGKMTKIEYEKKVSDWQELQQEHNRLGELFHQKKWVEIADQYADRDFSTYLYPSDDHEKVGHALLYLHQYDRAAIHIDMAVQHAISNHAQPYLAAAKVCLSNGSPERALEWVMRADPNKLRTTRQWLPFYNAMQIGGECFMKLKLFEEGINFLKQAPVGARIIDGDLANVLKMLGQFYERLEQYEKAIKTYQKVITVRYEDGLKRKIQDLIAIQTEIDMQKEERAMRRKPKKDNWE